MNSTTSPTKTRYAIETSNDGIAWSASRATFGSREAAERRAEYLRAVQTYVDGNPSGTLRFAAVRVVVK
jgi:hypothetical protein